MSDQMHKEGKKNRKHGRGLRSPAHAKYLRMGMRELHAASRLARFMRRHPGWDADKQTPAVDHAKLTAARAINRALAKTRVQS